jgi:Raf kinase inhibitor-like YbhB/YbcL family protein
VNGGAAGTGQAPGGSGGDEAGASGAGSDAGGSAGASGSGGAPSGSFALTSPAFEHVEACTNANRDPCNFFPAINTYQFIGGANQSPELNWTAGPSGTQSYVVCLHDTSVGNMGMTHWCIWNVSSGTRQLPANLSRQKMPPVPAGSVQDGFNNDDDGYVGPGARGNVYQFRLYALSVASYTPPNAEDRRTVYRDLEADEDGIVLATSTLRGRANPQQ